MMPVAWPSAPPATHGPTCPQNRNAGVPSKGIVSAGKEKKARKGGRQGWGGEFCKQSEEGSYVIHKGGQPALKEARTVTIPFYRWAD